MKIKCINNKGWSSLTLGKTYDVIEEDDDNDYSIIDDDNDKWWFSKEWFKPLYEIRNEKIDKLLE
jgi:hypothetical protein